MNTNAAAPNQQADQNSTQSTQFKLMSGNHRGRLAQIPIYLGKNFRMFIYQTDWKVLPMSALIAGLIASVVGENMFVTMEGQFQCSLALTCVCIWNGFFNSIQSVCRERPIIKREHRAGMHISSYIAAHLIYQMFLCAAQALITVSVCKTIGIKFPTEGFITKWFLLEDHHLSDHLCLGHHFSVYLLCRTQYDHGNDGHALYADLPAGFLRRRLYTVRSRCLDDQPHHQ